MMRLCLLSVFLFLSCTDNRVLDYTAFEITPNVELNLLEFEYPASAINAVYNGFVPNSFPVELNLFGSDLTSSNIESIQLNFFVENSIDQRQDISLVFYDTSGAVTFRIDKQIDPPSPSANPLTVNFIKKPNIDDFTKSTEVEIKISQPSSASTGTFRLECVLESTLILEDE